MGRTFTTLQIGPMWARGDLAKAPAGTTPKARNCVFRRGVVEKRPGFLYDSDASVPTNLSMLYEYIDTTNNVRVLYGGDIASGEGAYRNNDGSWTVATGSGRNVKGFADYEGTAYILGGEESTRQSRVDSLNGTTVTTNATTTRIGGLAMTTFIGRLVIGSPTFYQLNGGAGSTEFNSAGSWTVSGGWVQPTGTTVRTATIVNGATDAIKSTSALYTVGGSDEYVTACFQIQAVDAENETPITVKIENSTGATVYGSRIYNVPSASVDPEWRQYWVTALCPASAALYAKLEIGNETGDGNVGTQIRLSDSGNDRGFLIYPGRFVYPYGPSSVVATLSGVDYVNRVYWSEPLDFTDWRNENFLEVDDAPGTITALASVNNRLVVFKNSSMWTFRPGPAATNPLLREAYFPAIGCYGNKALVEFDNVLYFLSNNEVYAFDGASPPVPLCGAGMRDEIFNTQSISGGVLAVDTDNRELWVAARAYRIYIYSIDERQWIGYYQLTAPDASEEPFTPHGTITGMVYMQPQGESERALWVTYTTGLNTTKVARLSVSQTKDNLDGTERDIVAEYVFHPIETERWRQQVTIQYMGIDHRVTGDQTGSVTEYAFSYDGGATWSKYNQVTLTPAGSGPADTRLIRVPIHQTAPRLVFKIGHSGSGGSEYFNMTGGELALMVRGREIQSPNPTAVGSSL